MYLLYLDDSGSAKNKNEQYLVLGGLSLFERQVHWITQELDKLASSIYPAKPEAVEFHASEIFSGRTPPWDSLRKDERIKVIKDVLTILSSSHNSTCAFACAIHKNSFPGRDPMEIAFEELCNRFDLQLKRLYAIKKDPQRGMIILDESSYETSLQKLSRDFRSLGTRWGVIKNIPEVPLFVNSHASRLVQLADHIAYSVFRRYESGDTSYLDIFISKFDSEEGKLHGLVHKQTLNPCCMCPACMCRR